VRDRYLVEHARTITQQDEGADAGVDVALLGQFPFRLLDDHAAVQGLPQLAGDLF
jgi:hypothetical protein